MFAQNLNGLSNDEIMHTVPAVFAAEKHESRSARYGFISTAEMLDVLRQEGFAPTTILQGKTRIEGQQAYTKHLMRLRRLDDLGRNKPDVREVVVVNSHNGTSAYDLYSGIFRLVCSNGLVTGDIDTRLKIYHTKSAARDVIDGSFRIIEEGERVMKDIAVMKQIELSRPEQLLLAESALSLRFPEEEDEETGEITRTIYQPSDLLKIHRSADVASDLYTVSNVIQENAINGGLSRRDRKGKRHTTRAIRGIDQNVRLNQELWALTKKMMELKS